jgi:hypothetical protein
LPPRDVNDVDDVDVAVPRSRSFRSQESQAHLAGRRKKLPPRNVNDVDDVDVAVPRSRSFRSQESQAHLAGRRKSLPPRDVNDVDDVDVAVPRSCSFRSQKSQTRVRSILSKNCLPATSSTSSATSTSRGGNLLRRHICALLPDFSQISLYS